MGDALYYIPRTAQLINKKTHMNLPDLQMNYKFQKEQGTDIAWI